VQNLDYEELFDVINELILGVYMADILMKWYCSFSLFWKNGWNVFDVAIVIIMLLGVGKFRSTWCVEMSLYPLMQCYLQKLKWKCQFNVYYGRPM